MADFERIVMPGITHWQHPSFFAYFPANASPPSVLAEMLTATLGAQCMLWQTSPAATELETRVLDWLRQLIGLPGGLHRRDPGQRLLGDALRAPGGARARDRLAGERGGPARLPAARLLHLAEAHSSVEKAIKVAGLGRESLRLVATDDDFAMRPDALEAAIREDLAQGRRPAGVVASLGATGIGAIDPLAPIGEICRGTASISTSTPPGPAARCCSRSSAG